MGLTYTSTGAGARLSAAPESRAQVRAALAGNPNVGKSTVFNGLTGLHQHTGNWSGKTVTSAAGTYEYEGRRYALTDIPGAYSLRAASAEEAAARDFILFGGADLIVVVCDAGALERNLSLALQIMEVTPRVILAVNMMDEAKKRGIVVDTARLSAALGVPVVPMAARRGRGFEELRCAIADFRPPEYAYVTRFSETVERAVNILEMPLFNALEGMCDPRFAALRLLEGDKATLMAIEEHLGRPLAELPGVGEALERAREALAGSGLGEEDVKAELITGLYKASESIVAGAVTGRGGYDAGQLRVDRLLTRRKTALPLMLATLALVFYITVAGANAPSDALHALFEWAGARLDGALMAAHAPDVLRDAIVAGVWRVLGYVISVMLPPMAIFFPMFTLLEDLGYLPRVAFNLDACFRRAGACGKQCLTMAMGFGCNAAGVVGCRIIDSRRERLIAVLTNSLVPCNGRFPILIALITMFLVTAEGVWGHILSAAALTGFILLGVGATLTLSAILSGTLLRGEPSSPTLELPPFRRPKIGEVIVRSALDRTLFVLGRAAAAAAPAGLIIWLAANIPAPGGTVLTAITGALDPAGRALGMDGVILTAFILGLPANETVIPIMIMAYAASGTFQGMESTAQLHALLAANGWTWVTAVCTGIFTVLHWPCATTLLTIKKETGSAGWAALAALLPTVMGAALCALIAAGARLLG